MAGTDIDAVVEENRRLRQQVERLQEPRLLAIISNLEDRIAEAKQRGWLAEVEGLEASLAAARQKLEQMRKLLAQPLVVPLGTPRIWRPGRPASKTASDGP
jgi:hypothetical protein